MPNTRRLKNRKGMSLVELIVAVTILMFGLLTIVGVSSTTARGFPDRIIAGVYRAYRCAACS